MGEKDIMDTDIRLKFGNILNYHVILNSDLAKFSSSTADLVKFSCSTAAEHILRLENIFFLAQGPGYQMSDTVSLHGDFFF